YGSRSFCFRNDLDVSFLITEVCVTFLRALYSLANSPAGTCLAGLDSHSAPLTPAKREIPRFAEDFAASSNARKALNTRSLDYARDFASRLPLGGASLTPAKAAQLYKSFLEVQLSFYQGNSVFEMMNFTQLPPDFFEAPR